MESDLASLIEKYYGMQDGEHIKDFHHEFLFSNLFITISLKYRVLKHIIEQRKRDKYSLEDLKFFFHKTVSVIENVEYELISNNKEGNYFLIEKMITKGKGIVLVLEIIPTSENTYIMRTGFYRATKKILKLLKK